MPINYLFTKLFFFCKWSRNFEVVYLCVVVKWRVLFTSYSSLCQKLPFLEFVVFCVWSLRIKGLFLCIFLSSFCEWLQNLKVVFYCVVVNLECYLRVVSICLLNTLSRFCCFFWVVGIFESLIFVVAVFQGSSLVVITGTFHVHSTGLILSTLYICNLVFTSPCNPNF